MDKEQEQKSANRAHSSAVLRTRIRTGSIEGYANPKASRMFNVSRVRNELLLRRPMKAPPGSRNFTSSHDGPPLIPARMRDSTRKCPPAQIMTGRGFPEIGPIH